MIENSRDEAACRGLHLPYSAVLVSDGPQVAKELILVDDAGLAVLFLDLWNATFLPSSCSPPRHGTRDGALNQ
jgi:hypothetical protein